MKNKANKGGAMKKQKTSLIIRPAARGGKYLGHDAANSKNQSALIAILNPSDGSIVDYGFASAPDAQSAGPLALMGCMRRSDPCATDSGTVGVKLGAKIDEPTDFRVVVFGPLNNLDQARLAQADITVLPGVDIGLSPQYPEGLVIEVPGLCISNVTSNLRGSKLSCTARVTMMCGCPIHAGSADPYWPWPDTDFSIQLVTHMESGAAHHYPLQYDTSASSASSFAGQWKSKAEAKDAISQAWIYASQPKLGNQGRYQIYPNSASPFVPGIAQGIRQLLQEAGLVK